MSRLQLAIDQIRTCRLYTKDMINHVDKKDWFRQPAEGVTHVAWQVGHLAMAEYRLALCRTRGQQPEDAEFISEDFAKLFGKGSTPDPDPEKYPAADEILATFDRVHKRTIEEIATLDEQIADEPVDVTHPMFKSKLGALLWCAQHEMLHAGQLGLLRRLFGNEWLR